jgi:hypothetical protein
MVAAALRRRQVLYPRRLEGSKALKNLLLGALCIGSILFCFGAGLWLIDRTMKDSQPRG